ncbi:MAG: GTP cyclohydrolase I, partial [Youngiibacter sp.]|nr:GTP cyclohydrolase I [Youngiibacter sp.]
MDKDRIEKAVREILIAVGEDPDREGLTDTPKRIARMYEEIFSGIGENAEDHLQVYFQDEKYEELVLVKDIPFYSMC